MSEITTAARPYARAVFELARDQGDYAKWGEQLALMAGIAADPAMRPVLEDPRLTDEQQAEIFIEVCGKALDAQGGNFIKMLAENDRLGVLTEIAALYEVYRAEAEGVVEAQIISAQEVDEAQKANIAKALKARLGREINIKTRVDESLIGGAIIQAGDLVIDGSIRGRLDKMAGALNR